MEQLNKIDLFLSDAQAMLREFQKITNDRIITLEKTVQNTTDALENVTYEKKKLENEIRDLLSVSYVQKWKKQLEELQKDHEVLAEIKRELDRKIKLLKSEVDNLKHCAEIESPNQNLENLLKSVKLENISLKIQKSEILEKLEKSETTETSAITIETKKGQFYILKDNKLFNDKNKEIGNIVTNK
jgi:prophage DNA circulation protein